MKGKLTVCTCLIFSLLVPAAQAQITTLGVQKDIFKGSSGIKSIRLNETSLAFISNDDNKTVEIVGTDNNAKKTWTATVAGSLHDVGVLRENLLVVVSTDFTYFGRGNSTYKAFLVSADKGTVLKEKVLFNGNDDYHTFPDVLISKDKKTITLATRETAMKRNMKVGLGFVGSVYSIKRMSDQMNQTRAFKVLTFDEELNEKGAISPLLPEGDFIGIQKTINDDLYVAVSENKKGITISKYLAGTEKAAKSFTEPYSYYGGLLGIHKLNESISLYADTVNNNTIYITGSFKTEDDYITMFNKYDFAGDQHQRFKKSFTKGEVKGMEKAYSPVSKDFKKLTLAPAKFLELAKLVVHDQGYFMILSDNRMTTAVNRPPIFSSDGLIIYNLDKNLGIQTISTIPRLYGSAKEAALNVCLKDDYLYVLASHLDRANFITAKINTSSGKLENLQLVEPGSSKIDDFADLSNAVFNYKNLIIPVLDPKLGFGKIKYDAQLYQFAW